jgi:hypothetical protein
METIKIKAKKGIQSFLTEVGRWSRTSGFHYTLEINNNEIEIAHHEGKWKTIIQPKEIVVTTAENVLLKIKKHSMLLNEVEIDRLCDVKCYDVNDVIHKIILAVLLWCDYYQQKCPEWVYWWISG